VNIETALVQLDKETSSKINHQNLSRNIFSNETLCISRKKGHNQKKQNFKPVLQQLEPEI
jgi:hypothetical protein